MHNLCSEASMNMNIYKRKDEPAHYMMKIESFSLLCEAKTSIIQSDVFEASGHKWRLDLYPNGNVEENDGDYISLYVVICETESLAKGWEVCVDVNLYVYDHKRHSYAVFQGVDGNRLKFNEKTTRWGFDNLISIDSFKKSKNGYLCNDSCVFGAEVFEVPEYTQKDRCLSLMKPPANMNTYTWTIEIFSSITDQILYSDVFKVGKVKWILLLYPKGYDIGEGTHLAIYLSVFDGSSLPAGWRFYAKFKLRVKNQCSGLHEEAETDDWFYNKARGIGFSKLMLLSELSDPTEGFLLNDKLTVEAEFSLVGTFRNFI